MSKASIPKWQSNDLLGVTLTFFAPEVTPKATQQDTQQLTQQVHSLLSALQGEQSREELMAAIGLKDRNNFSQIYLNPALDAKLIERTIPDKPFSKNQRYRLTRLGRSVQAKAKS